MGMQRSHEDHIFKSSPIKLAKFLQASESLADNWHEDEYQSILEHQLNVPLCALPLSLRSTVILRKAFTEGSPLTTLQVCKEWAKTNLHIVEPTLPPSISIVIYYAAICAAQLQHHAQITTITADTLHLGLDWCLSREWLSPDIRKLFNTALQNLHLFSTDNRTRPASSDIKPEKNSLQGK
jgi:hypothetical protein